MQRTIVNLIPNWNDYGLNLYHVVLFLNAGRGRGWDIWITDWEGYSVMGGQGSSVPPLYLWILIIALFHVVSYIDLKMYSLVWTLIVKDQNLQFSMLSHSIQRKNVVALLLKRYVGKTMLQYFLFADFCYFQLWSICLHSFLLAYPSITLCCGFSILGLGCGA